MGLKWILVLLLVASNSLYAQDVLEGDAQDPAHDTDGKDFSVGGRRYDASLMGLRNYLDGRKKRDKRLYGSLNPDLTNLEERKASALTTGLLIGGGGVVLLGVGLAAGPGNSGAALAVAGTVVALGGFAVYHMMAPGQDDIDRLINKHNRLKPKRKIRWNVSIMDQNQKVAPAGYVSFAI